MFMHNDTGRVDVADDSCKDELDCLPPAQHNLTLLYSEQVAGRWGG